jgi:hypothetical protein
MKKIVAFLAALLVFPLGRNPAPGADLKPAPSIGFRMQEIETKLGVGYAVLLVDVNGDGKPDIVVVDQTRVVWYENPTWKRRTIIEGMTRPDNVCIAAHDIDGDGKIDFALGADWKPFNTKQGGTLQWLRRGKMLDQPWTMFPIAHEPTIHRIRFADLHGDGHPRLIVGPLMGQNSTKANNWMDGRPVRLLAFKVPKDPTRDPWVSEVLDERHLHVVHNFHPIPGPTPKQMNLLTASYEGVGLLSQTRNKRREVVWKYERIGAGNQDEPKKNRGAGEIKQGKLKSGRKFIATIEPFHGHQVVVYTEPADPRKMWDRHVVDNKLQWGHAVWCADLDGDGNDELIIGVRDNFSSRPGEQRGVRVYKAVDDKGAKWSRQIVDDGGVAVEDMAAADLNGDGKIDIVAVGRQTHNIRIYWNEGPK